MIKKHFCTIAAIGFFSLSCHSALASAPLVDSQPLPQPAVAAESRGTLVQIKQGAPTEYVVKKGDTLWDISALFLDDPWLWPELWRINTDIANPHLIYPGDKLYLVWVDGRPQLTRKPQRTLLPEGTVQAKRQPIPTFARDMLEPLLTEHRLVSAEHLAQLPVIVGDNRGAPRVNGLAPVFIDAAAGQLEQQEYAIFTPVAELAQGQLLRLVANVQITHPQDGYWQGEVSKLQREIRRGDVLLPLTPTELPELIVPSNGAVPMGHIIGSLNERREQGKFDLVVLDQGRAEGVTTGQMYRAVRAGTRVFVDGESISLVNPYKPSHAISSLWRTTAELPLQQTAELMVLQVQEHSSFAIVLRAPEWLRVGATFLPMQVAAMQL